MEIEYTLEDLVSFLTAYYKKKHFQIETDKILDKNIPWRPPLYAEKGEEKIAIDIRLNDNIPEFWLKVYKKVYEKYPEIYISVAIPDYITVPYTLGKKLEENNIGLILVSDDEINFFLRPRSREERETAKAIRVKADLRIDESMYEDLDPYVHDITNAVRIYEIGCRMEAIGAIGRILEAAIDDYLIEANKKHKIPLSKKRRKSMTFDDKINFLHSDNNAGRKKRRVITESQKAKMLSVKWDRNIGDHPAKEEDVDQLIKDSEAIFKLGINMIRLMKDKREEL